ncbi:MAG: PAS domain-containing protein [Aliidongia sp.]
MASDGADGCSRDAAIAMLEDQLAPSGGHAAAPRKPLRETHAAMIKHQQVGRMGDFRYNTRTQESRGSLECYKLFGYDPTLGQIDFSTWTEKIHPDDRPRIIKTLADAISVHAPILFEYRILLGGETRYIRCEGQPDHDHVGDVVYYGVLTDITERKVTEETLRAGRSRVDIRAFASHRWANSRARSFMKSTSLWPRSPRAQMPAAVGSLPARTARTARLRRWTA